MSTGTDETEDDPSVWASFFGGKEQEQESPASALFDALRECREEGEFLESLKADYNYTMHDYGFAPVNDCSEIDRQNLAFYICIRRVTDTTSQLAGGIEQLRRFLEMVNTFHATLQAKCIQPPAQANLTKAFWKDGTASV